jgi:hypothetical protein
VVMVVVHHLLVDAVVVAALLHPGRGWKSGRRHAPVSVLGGCGVNWNYFLEVILKKQRPRTTRLLQGRFHHSNRLLKINTFNIFSGWISRLIIAFLRMRACFLVYFLVVLAAASILGLMGFLAFCFGGGGGGGITLHPFLRRYLRFSCTNITSSDESIQFSTLQIIQYFRINLGTKYFHLCI